MKAIRGFTVVVCLAVTLATGSAFAGTRGDDGAEREMNRASRVRQLIHRILDYLDNKITIPPT